MTNVKSFRELLSRSFATINCDDITGEREQNEDGLVTGRHFIAQFEIDKLVEALRKTVANQEQE